MPLPFIPAILALIKTAGLATLGAAKASPGLLAAGVKATPGLLAKGAGQLNPLTVADGAQKASMMNKFLIGAKDLAGSGLSKINQLGIDPNSMGPNQPLMTRLGKAGQSKLGELVKELPQRGFDALKEQEKRNQELVSRYSTTPTLTPARPVRPAYSTNLQSILQDYRRS